MVEDVRLLIVVRANTLGVQTHVCVGNRLLMHESKAEISMQADDWAISREKVTSLCAPAGLTNL